MTVKYYISLLSLALILVSCGNNSNKSDETSQKEQKAIDAIPQGPQSVPYTAASFYKRYEGTIANQPVVMYLERNDSFYSGYYYYVKIGKPLNLFAQKGKDPDSLELTEYEAAEMYDENSSSYLTCKYFGDELKGKWSNGKKEYDIILKEIYPDGSYSFEMKKYRDTVKLYPEKKNSPQATSYHKFPWAIGNSSDVVWLNDQMKNIIKKDAGNKTVDEVIKESVAAYFYEYQYEIGGEAKNYKEKDYPASWSFDETLNCTLKYNEKGMVAIEALGYSYVGGAHGNYGSSFYNYDVTNRKILMLKDIVTIDSSSLQQLLEKQFRKDYKISPKAGLKEILFDEHLATTDNFYITDQGLGFLYNSYEVASYAQGQLEVFVPYTLLTAYLSPDFKKRMNL